MTQTLPRGLRVPRAEIQDIIRHYDVPKEYEPRIDWVVDSLRIMRNHYYNCGAYMDEDSIPWLPNYTIRGYREYVIRAAADGLLYALETGRASTAAFVYATRLDRVALVRLVDQVAIILDHIHELAPGEVPYILNCHPEVEEINMSWGFTGYSETYLAGKKKYWGCMK